MFLDRYLTSNNLEQTFSAVPTSYDINEILSICKSLKRKHGKLIIGSLNDQIEIRDD
jgi:hypothetical protein